VGEARQARLELHKIKLAIPNDAVFLEQNARAKKLKLH